MRTFGCCPVRSFLSLLNAVPKFLRDDRLVRIIKYILFIFIGILPFVQLEIGADRLTQNGMTEIFLSA